MAGDRVYFGVRGDGVPGGRPPRLVALSAQNGKLLWEMDLPSDSGAGRVHLAGDLAATL